MRPSDDDLKNPQPGLSRTTLRKIGTRLRTETQDLCDAALPENLVLLLMRLKEAEHSR